jgi:hypothetical protein
LKPFFQVSEARVDKSLFHCWLKSPQIRTSAFTIR